MVTARNARSKPSAADASAWLALDHQLCFALYSSSLAMTKLYKPLLEPLGLTYPQYLVMLVLWEADAVGIGVTDLGQRLTLDSGTLTPLLKRLETSGLLRRDRIGADQRRVTVQLSPAGRALKARAAKVPEQIACATGCELDELIDLTTRLRALRDSVFAFSERAAA